MYNNFFFKYIRFDVQYSCIVNLTFWCTSNSCIVNLTFFEVHWSLKWQQNKTKINKEYHDILTGTCQAYNYKRASLFLKFYQCFGLFGRFFYYLTWAGHSVVNRHYHDQNWLQGHCHPLHLPHVVRYSNRAISDGNKFLGSTGNPLNHS